MIGRLTQFGVQQFGRTLGVTIQVGQNRFDVEVRIQAYPAGGPRMELEGESSVFLSAFPAGRESGLQPRMGGMAGDAMGNPSMSRAGEWTRNAMDQPGIPLRSMNPLNPSINPVSPSYPSMNPLNPSVNPLNPSMNPLNPSVNPLNPSMNPLNPSVNPLNPSMNPLNPSVNPLNPSMNPVNPSMNPSMNPLNPSMNPSYPSMNPLNPSMNPLNPSMNQPTNPPSQTVPPTPLVQTANTLRFSSKQPLNVSIRDNQITVPSGAAGSQLFKVVVHNYSERKVMISLDPVLPPFACSYRDIIINPFLLLDTLTHRKRKVRIPISFNATTDGQSHSCVIGASVKVVD